MYQLAPASNSQGLFQGRFNPTAVCSVAPTRNKSKTFVSRIELDWTHLTALLWCTPKVQKTRERRELRLGNKSILKGICLLPRELGYVRALTRPWLRLVDGL